MYSDPIRRAGHHSSGSALLAVLAIILVISGLSTGLLVRSAGGQKASSWGVIESKLLFVAESGLHFNFLKMQADPLYAVTDTNNFAEDTATKEYDGKTMELSTTAGGTSQDFVVSVQYLSGGSPLLFADRTKPVETFDRIRVKCRSNSGPLSREVHAWYTYELDPAFGGAIVSDMIPTGTSSLSKGKDQAKQGDIVFDGKGRNAQHFVHGDVRANGGVTYFDGSKNIPLDADNSATYMGSLDGTIYKGLAGTQDEIPDFTSLGGSNQLFDFDRFQAVASAGGGAVYNSISDFVTAMKAANASGGNLEGVIVVLVDPATEGSKPKIKVSGAKSSGEIDLPGGINVTGTLVFRFADGTDPAYKVFIETGLSVNPADLSSLDPSDEATYASGYPGVYEDPSKRPWSVDISPAYENFLSGDDLPAVMFNNAVVDIHGSANVSGVVYGPSFIEIENKKGKTQYFNGALFGGGGIYIEGSKTSSGFTAIRFDSNTINKLETMGGMGQTLVRIGYAIVK